MAIKKSFGGASIRKPGAYSVSKTSSDSGSPLTANETLMLIGEAEAGAGGSEEGVQFFSATALNRLIAKYRSGPIVDAARVALAPSRTPGVNGAGRLAVYKTNTSVQATLALADSFSTLRAREYGVGGNRITAEVILSPEVKPTVAGSSAVTDFALLDDETLILRVNGGAAQTVTFAAPADIADVISQIEAQTTDIEATAPAGVLTLAKTVRTNGHREGTGQSLEVVGGTALVSLFLTAGTMVTAATEQVATIRVTQPRDLLVETQTVGGEVAMRLGRDGSDSATAATVEVTATSVILTATGSQSYTLLMSDFPLLRNLREAIEALPGWTVAIPASLNNIPTSSLDRVAPTGAFSAAGNMPARVKRDAAQVAELIESSSIVELTTVPVRGLPDAMATANLAGGVRGASSSSSFSDALSAVLGEEVNQIVPLISQDAAEDILDGETDPASTYDIETVHAMLDSHLRLRGSIKNRKEAQGWVGYRKQEKEEVFTQSATLGSELIQMCMQDVLVVDSSNSLQWKKPHILATMMAGMRLGTEVGEPLTHKFLAIQGAGHFVNPSTGAILGDFDPLIDFDECIDAGVTALEPAAGSFRVMVDNTTYGADANFVFNRGSVVEAAQYVARQVRTDAELTFVGKKNAIVTAAVIKSRVRAKLVELFEAAILSPSSDAPQGFREDTFIVEVTGNTAEIQVEVKPVQGLDFVFITFTLGETTQSA